MTRTTTIPDTALGTLQIELPPAHYSMELLGHLHANLRQVPEVLDVGTRLVPERLLVMIEVSFDPTDPLRARRNMASALWDFVSELCELTGNRPHRVVCRMENFVETQPLRDFALLSGNAPYWT